MRRSGEPDERSAVVLLQAAQELFTVRGFHRTGVADIAECAGTSVGTLYYYYGSKNEMARTLWARYLRDQHVRAHEAVTLLREAGVTDGRRLFLASARAYLTSSWRHRDIVRLVADGDAPPSMAAGRRDLARGWLVDNSDLLGIDDPVPGRVVGSIMTGSLDGVCREIVDCVSWEEADGLIGRAIEVYAALLGPVPAAPGPHDDGRPAETSRASSLRD